MTDATPTAGARRRSELGAFLKARRGRVSPDDVGLPAGGRRRTPGLRREEVALLAGVGVTWYTWLEQGRPINASAQVLDAVARVLRLDGPERWHLYRLADSLPVRMVAPDSVIPDSVKDVVRSMSPLPAVLVNGRFDVLMSNDEHEDLFWDWHSLPCVHKNLLWCVLTEPRGRLQLLNYDTEVPNMVARLRALYGEHLDDPEWVEDIARLTKLSPEFATLWARHDVAPAEPRVRRFRHPVAGVVSFTMTELGVLAMADTRIIAYTPADAETWSRMALARQHCDGAAPAARDATCA